MPRRTPIQGSFNAGELAPRLFGRTDIEKYKSAARLIQNFHITPQGPLVRRSGTRYVANAIDATRKSRLVPFIFSDIAAYVAELSHLKMRFFLNEGALIQPTLSGIDAETQVFTISDEFEIVGHGYAHNDGPVQLTTTGTAPGGLSTGVSYYARPAQTVTFNATAIDFATTDTITIVGHGLVSRMGPFRMATDLALPGGLFFDTDYYVTVVTSNTFQLSLLPGGAAVNFTSAGEGNHSIVPTAEYVRNRFRLAGGTAAPEIALTSTGTGTHTITPTTPVAIEIDTPYTEAELFELQIAQSADVLYIVHKNHRPRTLSRFSAHSFTLAEIEFLDGPYLDENADPDHTMTVSPLTGFGVTITSSKSYFTTDDVGTTMRIFGGTTSAWGVAKIVAVNPINFQDADIQTAIIASFVVGTDIVATTAPHGMDTGELVRLFEDVLGDLPDGLTVGTTYYVNATDATHLTFHLTEADAIAGTPLVDLTGTMAGAPKIISSVIDIVAHGFTGGEGPLLLSNATDAVPDGLSVLTNYYIGFVDVDAFTLSESRNGDAAPIDNNVGGGIHTLFGESVPLISVKANVLIDFQTGTVATAAWRASAWGDRPELGWPRSVTFYEQRLWFTSNPGAPQAIYGSKTADFTNFGPTGSASDTEVYSSTVSADNAILFVLGSNEVNVIQWLTAIRTLVMGTTSANWSVQASLIAEALTPVNIQVTGRSASGSNSIVPAVIDDRVVFVSSTGLKLFSVGYDFQSDSYLAKDLTILAEHITLTGILDMDYAHDPYSTAWCVRTDGLVAALTEIRDQKVSGWGRHKFGGTDVVVESVAVIRSPVGDASSVGRVNRNHDQVWLSVKRTVNGQTVRWVEFVEDDFADDDVLEDAFFVDGGITYNGAPLATIPVPHLTNETVDVLADGQVLVGQVVTPAGTLVLDTAASKVHIGFPYFSDYQSLRLALADDESTGQGKLRRIDHLTLRFDASMGGQYGPSVDDLTEFDLVPHDLPMDTVTPLFTDEIEVDFEGGWDTYAEIYLRQHLPLPFTIVAVLAKLQQSERGNRAR